jgi:uncharacterized protein Yka (UPF0111/DUF47 family)
MKTRRDWFLPKNPNLEGLLREQAAITVEGITALVTWASGDVAAGETVRACEHRADDKKRELWRALRDAFSPPIDAEDLYSLSADLDAVLNASKDLVRELGVMNVTPDAPMNDMATLLSDAVGHLANAFACLGGVEGDATEHADAAIRSERQVEHVYREAMSSLLTIEDLRVVMSRREAYRRMARIADLIQTVAERVWYAVVKEA